jgi:hypothetical protein
MIKKQDLKVGLLVWWSRDGHFSDWSCPCVVSKVDMQNNTFRVISFDDFKECDDLLIKRPSGGDASSLTEMELISLKEIEAYFREQRGKKYAGDPKKIIRRALQEAKRQSATVIVA